MLKVIPLPSLRSLQIAYASGSIDADSRACSDMALPRGVPRTAREWTALVKVASGETDIEPAQSSRLLELGLIRENSGTPELTPHGRLTLGLAE
jgi:hypothetical protein